jgi:hypothetical protein
LARQGMSQSHMRKNQMYLNRSRLNCENPQGQLSLPACDI